MKTRAVALGAVAICGALSVAVQAQEGPELRSDYPLCKVGTQMAFFMAPTVTDLYSGDAPDSVRVYPDGHPDKKASMEVGGRFVTVTQGRKAFEMGDCRPTDGLQGASVEVVEDCTETVPLPNGGCRRVRVSGSEWYTFGDAIQDEGLPEGLEP